jgi:hypothetical protein
VPLIVEALIPCLRGEGGRRGAQARGNSRTGGCQAGESSPESTWQLGAWLEVWGLRVGSGGQDLYARGTGMNE